MVTMPTHLCHPRTRPESPSLSPHLSGRLKRGSSVALAAVGKQALDQRRQSVKPGTERLPVDGLGIA